MIFFFKLAHHHHVIFLNLQMAVDGCCALILFRGSNSTQMLFDFLKFRSEAVNLIISQSGIKQQLQSFLQFIISSFATLHALFVGKELEGNHSGRTAVFKCSHFVLKRVSQNQTCHKVYCLKNSEPSANRLLLLLYSCFRSLRDFYDSCHLS